MPPRTILLTLLLAAPMMGWADDYDPWRPHRPVRTFVCPTTTYQPMDTPIRDLRGCTETTYKDCEVIIKKGKVQQVKCPTK